MDFVVQLTHMAFSVSCIYFSLYQQAIPAPFYTECQIYACYFWPFSSLETYLRKAQMMNIWVQ